MNTVLLIPDGIGVRNFVLGSFLKELQRYGPVTVLHDLPAGMAEHPELRSTSGVEWRPLPVYKEDLLAFELRQALVFGHFFWGDTFGMRCSLSRKLPAGSWKNRAARTAAMLLGRLAARPTGLQFLDQQHEARLLRSSAAREATRMLQELRPDVVFCSHQRPPVMAPFVAAARALGIPTATFIFSWDNLTSKTRMPVRFDHYLVWSDRMRAELLQFYPDIDRECIHLVGTPQFDPYADPELLRSREEFCRRVGADPARPIVCYSGGDLETAPDDPAYVEVLAELIEQGEIEGRPQLLVRPAPVDNGRRYRPVLERHPGILFSQPEWYHPEEERWNWVVPSPADIRLLVNTIHHSALNVNLASTMSLDFAIWDRPVVNMALDILDPPRWGYPAKEYYYRFEHYRPVLELGAVRLAASRAELRDQINAYLRDPSLDRAERRKLVEFEVSVPVGSSTRQVVDTLRQIAAGSAALVTH